MDKYIVVIDDLINKYSNLKDENVYSKNNLGDYTYKYTLNSYRELVRKLIAKHKTIYTNGEVAVEVDVEVDVDVDANTQNNTENKNTDITNEINNEVIDKYLLHKILTEYIPYIKNKIYDIEKIPVVEQKTPEWFKLRETMISASDSGYFLKKCGIAKAVDSLKIKLGLKQYVSSSAPPLLHGNTYEDVARAIYESRNKVKVCEYGILPSKTNCIGASPDGIIVECLDNSYECQSKFGRLLEIKNPYSREIDNSVKPEYMVQILQQQYTTGLPICDFVETTIVDKYCRQTTSQKPYLTINDMLNDTLDINNINHLKRIKNKNIPSSNLTKFGNEKGLVIWYQQYISNSDIRNKYIIYPLQNKYDVNTIEKWIIDTNATQFTNKFIFKEVKYWCLTVYSEKTIIYDQHTYEIEYIPILCNIWSIITHCRLLITRKDDINSYIEKLEYQKKVNNNINNPFYNEKKNKVSTNIRKSTSKIQKTNINNDVANTGCSTGAGDSDSDSDNSDDNKIEIELDF